MVVKPNKNLLIRFALVKDQLNPAKSEVSMPFLIERKRKVLKSFEWVKSLAMIFSNYKDAHDIAQDGEVVVYTSETELDRLDSKWRERLK